MSSPLLAPGRIAFKSNQNGKYVRYMREHGKTLQVSGNDTLSPYTRFLFESSAEHGEDHRHIKCYVNEKYLVARQQLNGDWRIFCDANMPEEDLQKSTCTLFQFHEAQTHWNITHCHLKGAVRINGPDDKRDPYYLLVDVKKNIGSSRGPAGKGGHSLALMKGFGGPSKDHQVQDPQLVIIRIPDHQFILPKNVCFKGDNGKFLEVQLVHEHGWNNNYLQFSSTDISDTNARHTICTNESDETIRIKADGVGRFWRRHPEWQWIWPDSDETDPDTKFRVIEWGDSHVVLQHIGSNLICRRRGEFECKTDCLRADVASNNICDAARLWVHEPLSHRKLYNVKYHLTDAIIREQKTSLPVATAHSSNHSSVTITEKLTLKYSHATHATWDTSIKRHSIGIKASVHANLVKLTGFSFDGDADLKCDNTTSEFKFQELHDQTVEQQMDINIPVPANTKVTVRAMRSWSSYDVPFSCDQEDTLLSGQIVTSKVEDGVFHGACSHDFTFDVTQENLPSNDEPSKNEKHEEPADIAKETTADGFDDYREDDVALQEQ